MSKASNILYKAADIIIERGHHQGSYVSSNDEVCAVGAIRLACGAQIVKLDHAFEGREKTISAGTNGGYDYAGYVEATQTLRRYLTDSNLIDANAESLPNWNDRNDGATVIAAMRSAAELTE